jgi:hypothetical protein
MGKQVTDDSTIWRMCIACKIITARDTHSIYICNNYCFSRAKWLRERASVLHLYVLLRSCTWYNATFI